MPGDITFMIARKLAKRNTQQEYANCVAGCLLILQFGKLVQFYSSICHSCRQSGALKVYEFLVGHKRRSDRFGSGCTCDERESDGYDQESILHNSLYID